MKKPIKSTLVNISSRKNHPINAETGIKKNYKIIRKSKKKYKYELKIEQ